MAPSRSSTTTPPEGHWADLGSGGGLPGLPFAVRFPDVRLDLVDSRQKRCLFLEEVVDRAGAEGIEVLETRIEDLEDGLYDGIIARGLAPADGVLMYASEVLRPGGRVVLFLQGDASVPRAPDYECLDTHRYEVGGKSRKSAVLRLL